MLMLAEWFIWGLWMIPGIAGVALGITERRLMRPPLQSYVAGALLLLSWPWAVLIGSTLPADGGIVSALVGLPFQPVDDGVVFDYTPFLLFLAVSYFGFAYLSHLLSTQLSFRLETREARITRYRRVGFSLAIIAGYILLLTDHPVVAGFMAGITVLFIRANSSVLSDPKKAMKSLLRSKEIAETA